MGAGGTKLPRSSPCSNSSASQAASQTSVLRPGKILTCRALTNNSSKPPSSRTYQIGFQYWPVASITTWVTPSPASHPANASSPEVNVGNVRTSWSRPPRPSGTRTHATTSSLATSNPAQRATSSSTVDTSPSRGWRPAGPTESTTLKRVLTATVRGAGKAPASVLSTGSLAPRKAELGRAPPILIPRGGHRPWGSYQQNVGNRCAKRRSRRSRSTVDAEVMCSHRVQLCVLLWNCHPVAVCAHYFVWLAHNGLSTIDAEKGSQ